MGSHEAPIWRGIASSRLHMCPGPCGHGSWDQSTRTHGPGPSGSTGPGPGTSGSKGPRALGPVDARAQGPGTQGLGSKALGPSDQVSGRGIPGPVPGATRCQQGPQGSPAQNLDFGGFSLVLGAGRRPRGFLEPMGTMLCKYQPKRSHMDLFWSLHGVFVYFPSLSSLSQFFEGL